MCGATSINARLAYKIHIEWQFRIESAFLKSPLSPVQHHSSGHIYVVPLAIIIIKLLPEVE